jgi:hypothetical protein
LAIEVENGMWNIPMKGHEDLGEGRRVCTCPVCQWVSECLSYPIGLSDILMSWWIAREGFRTLYSKIGPRIRTLSTSYSKRRSIEDDDD